MTTMLVLCHGIRERREPPDREAPKHRLNALPSRLPAPPRLLLLQLLDSCFVVPDRRHLRAQHDHREDGKEEALKDEEQQ